MAATDRCRPIPDIQRVAIPFEDYFDLRRDNQKGSPVVAAIRKESVGKNKAMVTGGNDIASPRRKQAMTKTVGPRKKQATHEVKNRRRRQCVNSETSADMAKYTSTPSGMSFIAQVSKFRFQFCK